MWRSGMHVVAAFMLLAAVWPTVCQAAAQCIGQPVPCSGALFQESQAICTSQPRAVPAFLPPTNPTPKRNPS